MEKKDLQLYLDQRSIPYDKRWSEDRLRGMIAEHAINNPHQDAPVMEKVESVDEPVKRVAHHNTIEDVEKAIEPYTSKEGFLYKLTEDEWHFKYKGAEEAGNMHIPLKVIVLKAQSVARGRRALMSFGTDGTYAGKYTDNILMA